MDPCNAQSSTAGPAEDVDGACGRFAAMELGTPPNHGNGSMPGTQDIEDRDGRRSPTI